MALAAGAGSADDFVLVLRASQVDALRDPRDAAVRQHGGVKAAVSFLSATELQCVTPQMPSGDAPLCVTLNGQPDPACCAPTPFEAYPATLLRGITPAGGPADGGTLVEVKGSGFASGTSLDCRFETEAEATVVTAQLVDDETLRCTVPPQPDGAGLTKLARQPWGELLIDKWNGVASNKV